MEESKSVSQSISLPENMWGYIEKRIGVLHIKTISGYIYYLIKKDMDMTKKKNRKDILMVLLIALIILQLILQIIGVI